MSELTLIEQPLVSIIVAIYNSEPFLKKCIESILSQDYERLEVILVNDGSPDNSGEICDYYASRDSRIIVIHKPNGGTCDARNAGLERATGDYILIVDGDDWLSPDCTSYLLDIIQNEHVKMSMTYNVFTTRDQTQVDKDSVHVLSAEEAVETILYPVMEIGPWNKMYERSMLQQNNLTFSVPWSGEGLYFAVMAAQYANGVGVGQRKIYNYRLNNMNSGLTDYNVIMGINALNNIKYIRDHLIVKTKRTNNAANWHIWKNHSFLLFLIIATNSETEHADLKKECIRYMRTKLLTTLIHSRVNLKEKTKMIINAAFPITFSRRQLRKQLVARKKDKLE